MHQRREKVWIGESFYEVATGNALGVLDGLHGASLHKIYEYSPDGHYVVGGGGGNYGTVDIWDVSGLRNIEATRRPLRPQPVSGFTSTRLPVSAIAFSHDSKYVLVRTLDIVARNMDNLALFELSDVSNPVSSFRAR